MGNSLLDVCVFGRRAGMSAAEYQKNTKPGAPNLEHVATWNREMDEAGLNGALQSPVLLPKIHPAELML
jgi:succinate dehydrogenase/fumarate reductase flavoprotein subunit